MRKVESAANDSCHVQTSGLDRSVDTTGHCPRVDPINCRYAYQFFRRNIQYMKDMIVARPTSEYWEQVRLILLQLQGLEDGVHERERINFDLRLDPYGLM